VFVADVSPLLPPGIIKTYESCADVDAYQDSPVMSWRRCRMILRRDVFSRYFARDLREYLFTAIWGLARVILAVRFTQRRSTDP
jgi:hypothetical protein